MSPAPSPSPSPSPSLPAPALPSESVAVSIFSAPRLQRRRNVDVEILAARLGRIAFGLGFIVGPCVALLGVGTARGPHFALFLLAGWVAAVVMRVVVKTCARLKLRGGFGRTEDEFARASLIVPGVALSIIGPISVHAPFALLLGGLDGLDGWAAMSFGVVGFAQLVLALLVARRAWRLVDGDEPMTTKRIYWIVVAVSCVPGIVFLGIPPLLTAVTGIVALPLLDHMRDIVENERRRLDDAAEG